MLCCALAASAGCAKPQGRLQRIYDAYWQERLERSPLWSTYIGDGRYDDKLDDLSVDAAEGWNRSVRTYLEQVERISTARLSEIQRLNRDIFVEQLHEAQLAFETREHLMPLVGRRAPQFQFPLIPYYQPLDDAADYRNYIARLNAFPQQVKQTISASKRGMEEGYVASREAVEGIIPQIKAHLVSDPKQSIFYGPASQFPDAISDQDRQALSAAIATSIETAVVPSFQNLLAFVENDYLPACRSTIGVYSLPEGKAIYAKLIRLHADTSMSADEIHELGLKEVERIRGELDAVRQELGLDGTVAELISTMRSDQSYYADSADEMLATARDLVAQARPRMAELFRKVPDTECVVRAVPADQAGAAPPAYYTPADSEAATPAYLNVNSTRFSVLPTYVLPSFIHREAYPGRHMQAALAAASGTVPVFRRHRRFDGFIEGWTLFADDLAFEKFPHEPADRYGHLLLASAEAARLVVDTGIHQKGWTRQQAIGFLEEHTALGKGDIVAEVDRQIAWPAQGLAPKLGALTIARVRREAEKALGDRFDIRAFDNALLAQGAMPMSILQQRMRGWVAARKPQAGH